MAWDRRAPFGAKTAQMQHYPETWREGIEWLHEDEFKLDGVLEFVRFDRGRSSVVAVMKSPDGREWPLACSTFEDWIPRMVEGRLPSMAYTFAKKGANFFIEPKEQP